MCTKKVFILPPFSEEIISTLATVAIDFVLHTRATVCLSVHRITTPGVIINNSEGINVSLVNGQPTRIDYSVDGSMRRVSRKK